MDLEIQGYRAKLATMLWGDLYGKEARQGDFLVRLRNYRGGEYSKNWRLEVLHRPSDKMVVGEAQLNIEALHAAPCTSAAEGVLDATLLQLVHQVAPYLYHLDPRIGTVFTGANGGRLPTCLLFDRPDGAGRHQEQTLRSICLYRHTRTAALVEDLIQMAGTPHSCPLCGKSLHFHISGKQVAWGGGALCWVHTDCWRAWASSFRG